ncbi:hypothetical protein Pryu01_01141 [Paraliobacillus ryukyuensis]|uniref:PAS domain S-box-containing protein/diguanylate cyclase (GGDEF)-like protein n=1 Tax=Paraliobacillus ryukyuensis TaxID=200904 RepID=A0A366ED24_9BACI|nr:histidine kinase N-terminal 7TM domain-containing protein [Paraliobacillus ryukyuensis]RBP00287.1 PAS domain S-box-containing protein/diguanylate cyclase (GGDEF)-like protein [Paraliobacillus ryukyuensis]
MNTNITAFVSLISISAVLNLFLAIYVVKKKSYYRSIATTFSMYIGSITIYCLAAAFGLLSTSIEQLKLWTTIQYIGIAFAPILGLFFVMQYLGRKVNRKRYLIFLVIPIITLLLVATNDLHHLYYRVYEAHPYLGLPYIQLEIGIGYVIHGIYTFSCMLAGLYVILANWKETSATYRPQLVALIIGQLIPMVAAFIYLLVGTAPGIDPVPMVLWISSLLYLWAMNNSKMFTVIPIAKDTIFQSMNDGVLVLDESYRLIEFNKAGQQMFPGLTKDMLGVNFYNLWRDLYDEVFPCTLDQSPLTKEIHVDQHGTIYQMRTSCLGVSKQHNGIVMLFTDITEMKKLQFQLEHIAYYDELTQVLNRRAFFQHCLSEFLQAKETGTPYTAILMDIDHFKRINDFYGHDIGDVVLQEVVQACKQQIGNNALFARYGGEEFVVAVRADAAEAFTLAEQMRQTLEHHAVPIDNTNLLVTFSIGIAQATGDEAETLRQLLKRADTALYEAKNNGRNQVRIEGENAKSLHLY